MFFRKKLLLFKPETTYGTDAAPTGAANAIQTSNLSITPLVGNTISRNIDRPTLGNDVQIHVGTHVQVSFDVEIAGSGVVDTPPPYGPLLRACGFAETITATTSVGYTLVSSGFESGTGYFSIDGSRHAFLGSRGDVEMAISPEGIPVYRFTFLGLWVDPAAVADPTPDFSAFRDPLAVSNDNTPTFTLHGASYNLIDLSLRLGNNVVYRNVVGQESVQITDRAPAGRVVIEAPDLGTKNWFTAARANTTGPLQLVHGTVAGDIVQIDAPNVQVLNPRYGEADGIATLEMDLSLVPSSAGDDELSITTR